MAKIKLTKAKILRVNALSNSNFKVPLLEIKKLDSFPFFLVIQSILEENIKLSIYPLKIEKITKISLSGFKLSNDFFEYLSKILREFQIIHSTGVILIGERLFYECYLDLSLIEEKSKNLKASFDKIKNIFKEVIIEEIGLNWNEEES